MLLVSVLVRKRSEVFYLHDGADADVATVLAEGRYLNRELIEEGLATPMRYRVSGNGARAGATGADETSACRQSIQARQVGLHCTATADELVWCLLWKDLWNTGNWVRQA